MMTDGVRRIASLAVQTPGKLAALDHHPRSGADAGFHPLQGIERMRAAPSAHISGGALAA